MGGGSGELLTLLEDCLTQLLEVFLISFPFFFSLSLFHSILFFYLLFAPTAVGRHWGGR